MRRTSYRFSLTVFFSLALLGLVWPKKLLQSAWVVAGDSSLKDSLDSDKDVVGVMPLSGSVEAPVVRQAFVHLAPLLMVYVFFFLTRSRAPPSDLLVW